MGYTRGIVVQYHYQGAGIGIVLVVVQNHLYPIPDQYQSFTSNTEILLVSAWYWVYPLSSGFRLLLFWQITEHPFTYGAWSLNREDHPDQKRKEWKCITVVLLPQKNIHVYMTPWGDLDCGLRFGIVLVLGIGIAHKFLSSIVLGIVLVCRPWYSPSLILLPCSLSLSEAALLFLLTPRKPPIKDFNSPELLLYG